MKKAEPKEYWDQNIESWGKFYLNESHSGEVFNCPQWFSFVYNKTIVPIEAKLMEERYKLTLDFVDKYAKPGMTFADIGCGTGIFTIEMLKRGANVIAIDLSDSSLLATEININKRNQNFSGSIEYLKLDVAKEKIPKADVALAMGVTPYVKNIEKFYGNILPSVDLFCCLFLDPKHWANKVRKFLPLLNVRDMNCFEKVRISRLNEQYCFKQLERRNFGSGYIDYVERVKTKSD